MRFAYLNMVKPKISVAMKNYLLVVLLCLLLSSQAHAQGQYGFTFGTGMSSSSAKAEFNGQDLPTDLRAVLSSYIGFSSRFPISPKFNLRPELILVHKGYVDRNEGFKVTTRSNFLSLPVWLEYRAGQQWSIDGGVEFGFLRNQSENFGNGEFSRNLQGEDRVDFGLNLGASYYITNKLALNLRMHMGLIRQWGVVIIDPDLIGAGQVVLPRWTNDDARNRSIHLGISYVLFGARPSKQRTAAEQ